MGAHTSTNGAKESIMKMKDHHHVVSRNKNNQERERGRRGIERRERSKSTGCRDREVRKRITPVSSCQCS